MVSLTLLYWIALAALSFFTLGLLLFVSVRDTITTLRNPRCGRKRKWRAVQSTLDILMMAVSLIGMALHWPMAAMVPLVALWGVNGLYLVAHNPHPSTAIFRLRLFMSVAVPPYFLGHLLHWPVSIMLPLALAVSLGGGVACILHPWSVPDW